MPGGCKSILNVKCLHKSYIAELFGPRVFCFSGGRFFFFFGEKKFKKKKKKKKGGGGNYAGFFPTTKKTGWAPLFAE